VAHDDERIDDWYWVRDREDPALMPLLEAENAYTEAATAHLEPLVEQIYQEILSSTKLTDVTYPTPKGPFAYYTRTIEGKEHVVSCRRSREAPAPEPGNGLEDAHETVLLDENELAEGQQYFEVGDQALSHDQRLLAYAVDTTGSEVMTVRVREIESGRDLDEIEGASYGLAFAADSETLFYTRPDDALRPYQIWRHRLGAPTSQDVMVLEEKDERFAVGVGTTKDSKLVVFPIQSTLTSEWRYVPAASPEQAPAIATERRHGVLYSIEHHRGDLVILSNDGCENFALFTAPLGDSSRERWQPLLVGRDDILLEEIDVVAGHVLVEERGYATTAVRALELGGTGMEGSRLISAPPGGTASLGHNLEFDTTKVRYVTTSLIEPATLHELDLVTGASTELRCQPVPGFHPGRYQTDRLLARSADGTEVPVTLAWHVDRPAGPGPALLYGYGAYGTSSDPTFRLRRPIQPLLDRGVLFAIAHVRGGEELGRNWYLDGKFSKKRNTFDDFLAAARLLSADRWTTPAQLAALGGSAGGLLVGASLNEDPDAFGAAVAEVPFVDVLTTMLDASLPLTTNEWEEWGDPVTDEDAYRWIKAYSPYDNVRGRPYPKMLVTAGISDPRVGFHEPVKWVQKLRAAHPENESRVLLKMELAAGHFGPSGRYAAWRKWAFVLAWLVDALGAPSTTAPEGE
jgi:oligopeptidase B